MTMREEKRYLKMKSGENQDLHNGRGSTESHTYVEILMFYFQRSALGHTWDENGISVSFLAVGRT